VAVSVDEQQLAEAVSRGIEELRFHCTQHDLARFYSALLENTKPAVLRLSDRELSAEALMAIILPLPEVLVADGIRIAGGWPSNRFEPAGRWNAIAVTSRVADVPTPPDSRLAGEGMRLAAAIFEGRPQGLRTGSGAEIVMWGPVASGKTALLAQIFLRSQSSESEWMVRPTPASMNFISDMLKRIQAANSFPAPTAAAGYGVDLGFRLMNKNSKKMAEVTIRDRPGGEFERLDEDTMRLLQRARGLVLLFDHTRDPSQLSREVQLTVLKIYTDLEQQTGTFRRYDPRPVAVCLSKADLLIDGAEDLELARRDPDTFVTRTISPEIVKIVREYYPNSRFFPISSIGVRLQYGVVQRMIFYDEDFGIRVGQAQAPLNLLEPFAWLLEQLEEVRE
jgi:hypothetical protein